MDKQELFLNHFLANDHARQVTATYYAAKLLTGINNNYTVIDLGCGRGETEEMLKNINPGITWFGIDVKDSPEVRERYNKSNHLITYDGINIPVNSNAVDIIYCRQVFEHVEYPHELIREIIRVLKPGGHIIGSVSQLEPYHSFSIFNFTIYGVCKLFNKDGLTLKEIRPGIDGLTLIVRRGFNRLKLFDHWFNKESPLNKIIDTISYLRKWKTNKTNLIKLMFCGHVIFWATKNKS